MFSRSEKRIYVISAELALHVLMQEGTADARRRDRLSHFQNLFSGACERGRLARSSMSEIGSAVEKRRQIIIY